MAESVVAPGLGKNVKKRTKAYLASIVFFVVLFVSQLLLKELAFWQVILLSCSFGFFVVFLGFLVTNFKGNIILFLKLFLMPFLLVMLLTFTMRQIFFTEFQRIADIVIYGALVGISATVVYGILLTANVLYISSFRSIPLVQVAHSVWYILTVAVVFILTYWVLVYSGPAYFVLPILLAVYFAMIIQHLSHFELSDGDILIKAIGLVLGVTGFVGIVFFWPTPVYVKAFSAALAAYVGLGFVMHELKKVLHWRIYVEYFLLLVAFIVALMLTSSWGIFGRIV